MSSRATNGSREISTQQAAHLDKIPLPAGRQVGFVTSPQGHFFQGAPQGYLPLRGGALGMTIGKTENIRAGEVIFHGARDKKEIALTFDADMTPGMKKLLDDHVVESYYDKRITDYLTQTQTKATLFLSGMWIETYPDDAKVLGENSLFELGNHSYSHPSFTANCYGLTQIPDSENEDQMKRTQALLVHVSKKSNMLFRFPGGCYSPADLVTAKDSGLTVIQWDVAGDDGFNNDASSIVQNIVPFVRNGSIIVLHMSGGSNAPKTMDALPQIVTTLKAKGYTFVTVSELFKDDALIESSLPDLNTTFSSK